jgi:hypothetical protein
VVRSAKRADSIVTAIDAHRGHHGAVEVILPRVAVDAEGLGPLGAAFVRLPVFGQHHDAVAGQAVLQGVAPGDLLAFDRLGVWGSRARRAFLRLAAIWAAVQGQRTLKC